MEQNDEPLPPLTSATELLREAALSADHVLQALIDLANVSDVGFGITLSVAGFLVSGTLVSGKSFFDGLSKEVSDGIAAEENKDAVRKYFAGFGSIYAGMKDEEERDLPIFIHLKDARFFQSSGGPVPGNRGIWWRGRVSAISGFFLGELGGPKQETTLNR
jgi:hypothetical protein